MKIFLVSLILFLSLNSLVFASEEFLPEAQEKRANELFLQIKCLVCEGQVIESSNAEVAYELRKLVRDKIASGQSNEEIKNFLVKNYGEEILTKPPFNSQTALLWLLPVIFFIIGIGFFLKFLISKKKTT